MTDRTELAREALNTDITLMTTSTGNRVFAAQGREGLGIDVGGACIVLPVERWHALAALAPAPAEPVARPNATEKDINRWKSAICERPEGPWTMGNGGSFDRTTIHPISDEMLAELAQWLYVGYTPWNARSMPLSAGDRQFMYMLYYSVQGLIARMRAAEKAATPPAVQPLTEAQIEKAAHKLSELMDYPWAYMPDQGRESMRQNVRAVLAAAGITSGRDGEAT
jgi:hypothetical protein